jgi:hypothetical protein
MHFFNMLYLKNGCNLVIAMLHRFGMSKKGSKNKSGNKYDIPENIQGFSFVQLQAYSVSLLSEVKSLVPVATDARQNFGKFQKTVDEFEWMLAELAEKTKMPTEIYSGIVDNIAKIKLSIMPEQLNQTPQEFKSSSPIYERHLKSQTVAKTAQDAALTLRANVNQTLFSTNTIDTKIDTHVKNIIKTSEQLLADKVEQPMSTTASLQATPTTQEIVATPPVTKPLVADEKVEKYLELLMSAAEISKSSSVTPDKKKQIQIVTNNLMDQLVEPISFFARSPLSNPEIIDKWRQQLEALTIKPADSSKAADNKLVMLSGNVASLKYCVDEFLKNRQNFNSDDQVRVISLIDLVANAVDESSKVDVKTDVPIWRANLQKDLAVELVKIKNLIPKIKAGASSSKLDF